MFSPSRRPPTRPSRLPPGCAAKLGVTSTPFALTRTVAASMPAGGVTLTSTWPPLTSPGRGFDTDVICSGPPAAPVTGTAATAAVMPATRADAAAATTAVLRQVRIALHSFVG